MRRIPSIVLLSLIVFPIIGVAQGTKSVAVKIEFNQRVRMRDGVELSADIYRPDASGRFPVVLTRTPYGRQGAAAAAKHFAEHGYVYVAMDVRGRGDSAGDFVPWRNEGNDGYDSIEWCARQPWSNGKIGTTGLSYAAYDEWLAAVRQPPHLAAMFVHSPMSDPFFDIWLAGPGGLPTPMQIGWFYRTSQRAKPDMSAIDWGKIYWHVPLYTLDEATGHTITAWRDVIDHSQLSDWWSPMRYQNQYDRVSVPILHLSGWYDDTLVATPMNFIGMTKGEKTAKSQQLIIGPWAHSNKLASKLGEIDFGPSAQMEIETLELRWFDHWLKGIANGVDQDSPLHIFIMGENQWHDFAQWPIAQTQWTKFYFHSKGHANSSAGDGNLSLQLPVGELADKYEYDPENPVPFITDANFSQVGGPDDYQIVERRNDVLVYSSEPLTEDTTVCGPISVQLYAASSADDTDFMAKLLDVWPNGFAQRLNDGMVRARFRGGMDQPSMIKPNQTYSYTLNLWDTCQMFAKGHRIRVEISSSAFPKYDRNPNTGEALGKTTHWKKASQTIVHDADHPSSITLPIIPTGSIKTPKESVSHLTGPAMLE
ncbi:MAG TPA: CocE/NonD family hydrolase [Pyrinomonadaceae bacterium]|nr:CocE/NonD family hydrolase [Pyrinomonadaceae bacterium]